jgi:methylase of polypeptide subunit release factors
MVHQDLAVSPTTKDLFEDFYLLESNSNKFLAAKGVDRFKIRIKKGGYVPKGGLYLVKYLANEDLSGSCLDIGTGETGVIAQFAKLFGADQVTACDIDNAAIAHARHSSLQASEIEWLHSDVYDNILQEQQFDTIVSNPPQLPSLNVESPHDYGGKDGLDVIERILEGGRLRLNPGGRLLLLVFDFLYDHEYAGTNRSLKTLGAELGYESKVVASYEREVSPSGKTFENKNYIERMFSGFRFRKNGNGKLRHFFYIVEFKVMLLLCMNTMCPALSTALEY